MRHLWCFGQRMAMCMHLAGLYAQIYKDLYRFAVCTLQNLHDAEDAVSETVLDAFAQIGSLRKPESFKSWMFAILSVKCRKKIQDYGKAGMELTEDLMRTEADLSEQLDVQEAFQRLSKEERMMLALKLFAGYSSNEIGALFAAARRNDPFKTAQSIKRR